MPKLTESYKEILIARLNDADIEKIDRLGLYLLGEDGTDGKPYATKAELKREGFSSLVKLVNGHLEVLREYCGIQPKIALVVQKRKSPKRCKPARNYKEPLNEDVQINPPHDENPGSESYALPDTPQASDSKTKAITLEDRVSVSNTDPKVSDLETATKEVYERPQPQPLYQPPPSTRVTIEGDPDEVYERETSVKKLVVLSASVVKKVEAGGNKRECVKKETKPISRMQVKEAMKRMDRERRESLYEAQKLAEKGRDKADSRYTSVPKYIMDKVIDIVSTGLSTSRNNVTPSTSLINDLGANHLDEAELYSDLEDEFKIEIREDEDEPLSKNSIRSGIVGDIALYIMKQKRKPKETDEETLDAQTIALKDNP